MVLEKNSDLEKNFLRLADYAKALSHPVRIRILHILERKKTCICGEIVDQLPLSQSTVSQHLKELKRVGFIHGEIEGPKTCYCLSKQDLYKARELFSSILSLICNDSVTR